MQQEKLTSTHFEHTFNPNDAESYRLIALAREGDEIDASLTIRQALKKYKKAVFWATVSEPVLLLATPFVIWLILADLVNCSDHGGIRSRHGAS